jgi:TonB family protein
MSFCQIKWWILVLCGLFAVRPVMAQSIEGTAFDISGAVVPGARVILMVDYVKQKETVTDEHGRFSFSGLQPGMYYVQIKQPRFSLSQQHLFVKEGQTTRVYAVLTPGHMSDQVTVASSASTPVHGNRQPKPFVPPIGGKVDLPELLSPARPHYPEAAKEAGIEGTVVLYARIKLDGTLDPLVVLDSPDSDLEAAARSALAGMRYRPMQLNGKPVDCEIELRFDFQLEEK